MMSAENWIKGIQVFSPLIEIAFSKASLIKRVDFISKLIRIPTECYKEVLKIEKLKTFMEWINENYKEDDADSS